MIDGIEIELNTKNVGRLLDYRFNTVKDFRRNKEYHNCSIGNLKITYTEIDNHYRIKVNGSIHKFLHGYNITRFTRVDIKKSINKLSKLLELDFSKGLVKKIEIGANISLDYSPPLYNQFLLLFEQTKGVRIRMIKR